MFEVDEAARIITDAADPDANIIFGAVIDENFTGEVKCTVIATGFDMTDLDSTPAIGIPAKRPLSEALSTSAPIGGTRADIKEASSMEAKSTAAQFDEEELEVPAFMRKTVSGSKMNSED